MTPETFIATLKSCTIQNGFNPYTDHCPEHDYDHAPELRSRVLSDILETAAETGVHSIWIGRDLGYRGGRRTGLALTDDVHIAAHMERWGLPGTIEKPTFSDDVKERTASVVWGMLNQIPENIFLWNVFPFHPHEADKPLSNRAHNLREREIGENILSELIAMLRPQCLVSLGNDATETAHRLRGKEDVIHVRHPSYGGQAIFRQQITELYELPSP